MARTSSEGGEVPLPLAFTGLTTESITLLFCLGLPILPHASNYILVITALCHVLGYGLLILKREAVYAGKACKVVGWFCIMSSVCTGFVAPTVLKAFERPVFKWIGLFFLLCVALVRGSGGVLLIKLQQMEALQPRASLAMVARENIRLQTVMIPSNSDRNRISSSFSTTTGIVVPSHAASRGRDSFEGVFELAMDGNELILGNEERENRARENRERREQEDKAEEARERRMRLDRLRNKHRTRESLRKGGEGNTGADGKNENESDNSCSICLEVVSKGGDNRMLECGHVFHKVCIDQWLKQIKRGQDRFCPVCRFKI
jgi:hypothetical protein